MATKQNHFDGPDGTTITTTNSASTGNDALANVTITGLTITYSATQKMHGTTSAKITPPTADGTSSSAKLSYTYGTGANVRTVSSRFYLYLGSLPTRVTNYLSIFTATGYMQINALNIQTDGRLNYNVSDGSLAQNYTGFAFAPNTWYRIENTTVIDKANGSINTKVYAGDSNTLLAQLNPTGVNTLGGDGADGVGITTVQIGKIGGAAGMSPFYVDDFTVVDGSTAPVGPYVPGAPVVSAASSVNGSTGQLNATATTYDGSVSYAWTQLSGPATLSLSSTTTSNPSAPLTVAGDYSFRVTVTDDLNKTATATTTFTYAGLVNAPNVSAAALSGPRWMEQVTAAPAAGGALTYAITPTGPTHHGNGLFSGAVPSVSTQYTVTVTEAGNPNTTQVRFTVAGTPTATGGIRILVASADQSAGGSFS